MKRLKHKNKRFNKIPIFIGMTVMIIGLAFWLLHPKTASADWYNTNWDYRQAVTVTVPSNASDITSLETLITVNTSTPISAGKLQSSCQDLRFTSATGKLLPYYIDSGCNGASTKIWVMVDLVPKNTTTYLMYMYYGNPAAVAGTDATKFRLFNGLVGYWPMNESAWAGSAGEVKDVSVTGNNGTANNGASITTGQYSNGGSFTSASSHYIGISSTTLSYPYTYSFWAKPTALSGTQIVIGTVTPGGGQIYLSGSSWTADISGSGGSGAAAAGTAGQWQHVVAVFNSLTNRQLYINGVLQSTNTATPSNASVTFSRIAARSDGLYFGGSLDDVRLYNRGLTGSEISQLYQNPGNIASNLSTNSNPTTSFGSETQAPGPIAYWKFDDGTGTSANDSSSNAKTGTLSGLTLPTWQTEDQCINGKCLYFDGSSSYVTVTNNTVQDANSISTSLWFKDTNVDANYHFLLAKGRDTSNSTLGYGLRVNNDKKLYFYYQNAGGNLSINSTAVLTQGLWYHAEATYDATTHAAFLYINGIQVATSTSGTGNLDYGTVQPVSIGSWQSGAGNIQFFPGFIDEVKVYPYARSAAQVQSDFNSRGSLVASGNTLGASTQNNINALNQGLVGYWKMDESSGNATDSSGNSNTGTATGTAVIAGKFGNGRSFNGGTDKINVTNNSTINLTSQYTLSAWIYSPDTIDKVIMSNQGASQSQYGFTVAMDGVGRLRTFFGTGSVMVTALNPTATPINTWTHIVATWNGSNLNLYVNGLLVKSVSSSTGPASSAQTNLAIGGNAFNNSEPWDGYIDEARVYNRALSPEDVQNLYNFAPGPIAYYNFEEAPGSTSVSDRSGSGFPASWVGTAQYTTGKYGTAGNFNGTSIYLNTGNAALFDTMGTTKSFSLGAWVNYPSNGSGSYPAIAGNLVDNSTPGYALLVDSNNDSHFNTIYAQVGDGTTNVQILPTTNWADSKWHYAAMTVDRGAQTLTLYVDGVSQGSASISGVGSMTTTNDWHIGARDTSEYLGKIDEVRLYNYAETQKQVISDMNANHPSVGSPVGSATGYWKFEEGADNKCSGGTNDACNSGNAGSTLDMAQSGMAVPATSTSGWTNSGKFGKALNFDGTNDYLSAGNATATQITGAMTISAWVNLTTNNAAHSIVSKYGTAGGGTEGYELRTSGSGKAVFALSSTGGVEAVAPTSTQTLSTGTWYHIVGVYIPSVSATVYINGVQAAQTTTSVPAAIFNTSSNFLIGARDAGPNTFTPGSIDEVKLYSYALTPDEVNLDYNRGSSEVLGALSDNSSYQKQAANQQYCVPGDATSCVAPVGEWNFEEGSGSSVNDTSGNGNTGTFSGSTPYYKPGYPQGWAGNFNGVDDWVSLGTTSLPTGSSARTIEGWFNSNSSISNGNDQGFFDYGTDISGQRVSITANKVEVSVSINGCRYGKGSLTLTGWHYITVIFPTSSTTCNQFLIYLDGNLQTLSVLAGTGSNSVSTGSTYARIGKDGAPDFYSGKVDQVRVFNYARTPAQVALDYNKGLPVGWWKLDECQGTVANDSSGQANTGTITIGSGAGTGHVDTAGTCQTASTAWGNGATGKYNSSLSFDGIDDYVGIPSSSVFNLTTNFAISAWIKSPTLSTYSSNAALVYRNGWFSLAIGPNSPVGNGQIRLFDTSSTNGAYTNNTFSNSTWHHVVAVMSGGTVGGISIYVDGVRQAVTTTGSWTNPTGANALDIGGAASSAFFNGQIDDVRVYNYPLTTTQIQNLYNQGSAVRYGPTTGAP